MTLLQEITAAATDSKTDISTVLRKAKILATRLRVPEFERWVDQELNGYEERSDVPPYRTIPVVVQGHIRFGPQHHWDSAPIMCGRLPQELRHLGLSKPFVQPIGTIAAIAEDKSGGEYQFPWPQEAAVKYGATGYNGECIAARQIIHSTALIGIVEAVRNRILDFVLKIEAENPDAGEARPNTDPVPQETVQTLTQNIFYAPVGNIAQNSEHFSQTATTGFQPGDLTKLLAELNQHLHELKLDPIQEQRAKAQIEVLRAETAGQPDPGRVRQALHSLRNITEHAIAILIAEAVTNPTVWQWIQLKLSGG